MHNYTCHTCQEPMKITDHMHSYLRLNGPTRQKCFMCGAIHLIDAKNNVSLVTPGHPVAKLSMVYPYPEYAPYRVGPYRVLYENGNWAKVLVTWNGEHWHNGPIVFSAGAIVGFQGLAGDMEHTKRMPYDLAPPIEIPNIEGDEE